MKTLAYARMIGYKGIENGKLKMKNVGSKDSAF
jgi:hypothetical protein